MKGEDPGGAETIKWVLPPLTKAQREEKKNKKAINNVIKI